MRIVETDNYGGDYPNENFVLHHMSNKAAKEIVDVINKCCSGELASRYWKVVNNDYKLQPGFEP